MSPRRRATAGLPSTCAGVFDEVCVGVLLARRARRRASAQVVVGIELVEEEQRRGADQRHREFVVRRAHVGQRLVW